MKITDLDAKEARSKAIRVEFDGFDINIGGNLVSLEGQWIDVLPTDSEEFHQCKLAQSRKALAGEKINVNAPFAAIIKDWSFDEPCDEKHKLEAIDIWPRVLVDHIDEVASKAVNFTRRVPKRSEPTRKGKGS